MKKWILICICAILLSGCSTEAYETLGNVTHVSATEPAQRQISLQLPADAAVLTSVGTNAVYLCEGYSIVLQTFSSGDLDATVRSVSGFPVSALTMLESVCGDHRRYDFVWTAVGEGGDQICRAAVLDDGNYHYTLTLMADANTAGQWNENWNRLLSTFCLAA